MQKIMFNDKYGLTKAVLEGKKTQTRRVCKVQPEFKSYEIAFPVGWINEDDPLQDPLYGAYRWVNKDNPKEKSNWIIPQFKVGEVVAIAQSYKDAGYLPSQIIYRSIPEINGYIKEKVCNQKGWNNKMFVGPNLMPHQIRITNVRVERLQDISDEDCLAEGVVINEPKIKGSIKSYYPCKYLKQCADNVGWGRVFDTPQKAYAELIDKVSGKGTWERNPYVFVYDFELIK